MRDTCVHAVAPRLVLVSCTIAACMNFKPVRSAMLAMLLEKPGTPLRAVELPRPAPGPRQVLIEVRACGVCRTDLHVVDGELEHPKLPLVPGHEIVGTVVERGSDARAFRIGDRVGVPWLG